MTEPCEFLPWDTEFFGERIARVNGHRLDAPKISLIKAWCLQQSIACAYFLADADDPDTTLLAEENGYRLVDVRLTFEHDLKKLPENTAAQPAPGVCIRPFLPEDIPLLQGIARDSYTMSRFYSDTRFSRQKCSDLYDTWIQKSCHGYAEAVWVAEVEGQAVGYVTCHLDRPEPAWGQIGLVGIGAGAQGRGIGQLLIARSLVWFAGQGMKTVEVVTQGQNLRAQRLYQRSGFVSKNLQLWYHVWFQKE